MSRSGQDLVNLEIGKRIKECRKRVGVSTIQIAEKFGIDPGTVHRWERGFTGKIPVNVIAELAKWFNITPLYLMGLVDDYESSSSDNLFQVEIQKIPLLGEIACGEPIYASEDFEVYVEIGAKIKADFCLRCKGDSMINARINDGDIVFIRKQSVVNNGEIAVVIVNDEATLKRVFYYPDKSKLVLQAENPLYEPYVYVGEELNQVSILGKAVAFQSDVK